MTSKLVVNTIEADTGISSVSFASSISMNSTAKFHFSNAGIDIGADTNINRPSAGVLGFNVNGAEKVRIDSSGHMHGVGVVTATHFYGDGSNLTGISAGTSLSGSTNNTLVTVTGANAITGESTLTYDGSSTLKIQPASAAPALFIGDSNRSGAGQGLVHFRGNWNGTTVARITIDTGDDTTNKDDGIIRFDTSSTGSLTERVRINRSGYLGIGNVTSPDDKVEIRTGANDQGVLIKSTGSTSNAIKFDANRSGANQGLGSIKARWNGTTVAQIFMNSGSDTSNKDDGYIIFGTESAASNGNVNATERMRLNSNGSLSIANTRNYYGALNVEKTATSSSAIDIKASGSGSYAQAISFGDHNTISGELKIKNSTDITLGTSSNHPFVLLGNNVAGLKISNSNGRLERNFGAGSGHTADGMWFNNGVTATGYFVRFWQTSGSYGANQIGSITHTAYNTQYNTSSDYRLKENAVKISDGIARLKLLKPYRFNFKTEPSKTVDGFFAHEAATVIPEAVTGTKDEVADSDSPDIGQKVGDPIHQGMDYSKVTPLLTAALQEAIAKIETLESEVAALKGS